MGKSTIKRKKQNDWAKKYQRTNISQEEYEKKERREKRMRYCEYPYRILYIEQSPKNKLDVASEESKHRKYSIYMKRRSYSSAHRAQMLRICTKIVEICRFTSNIGNSNLCAEEECFSDLKIVLQIWYELIFFWKLNITFPFDI